MLWEEHKRFAIAAGCRKCKMTACGKASEKYKGSKFCCRCGQRPCIPRSSDRLLCRECQNHHACRFEPLNYGLCCQCKGCGGPGEVTSSPVPLDDYGTAGHAGW